MSQKKKRAIRRTADAGPHPRQPCPCGSGKRYRACHGSGEDVLVSRPFAGLAAEPELVALREFIPSATAPLPLAAPAGRDVMLASVLPGASAALVRDDGTALVGLQVQTRSGDLSADLGRALAWALAADPGATLAAVGPADGSEATRLQDLLDPAAALDVMVHGDFGWWFTDAEPGAEAAAALERANALIRPTEAVVAEGVRAAYWVDPGTKAHLRWVRAESEEELLDALARLRAAGALNLGDGSRYAGMFRAHGLVVPVWDLDRERHPKEWAAPAAEFATRLAAALAGAPLTAGERRAREALAGGQVTLR